MNAQAETGLYCLALICAFNGQNFDAERARRDLIEPGRTSDFTDIVRAAKREGFKAKIVSTSVERMKTLPVPLIGRKRDGAFFVIAKLMADGVLVGDAGGPPQQWSFEKLSEVWSGDAILLSKRASETRDALSFGFRWFMPVVSRFRKILAEVLLISAFIQILGLVSPLFTQVVIDKVFVHRGFTTLEVLVIGLIAIGVIESILTWLRTYSFAHTTSRIDAILGSQLFRHLTTLPVSYFENRATGQTVARVRELENIRQFITGSALTLVIDIVFSILFLAVMFYYSVKLAMVVVVTIPLYVIVSAAVSPSLQERVKEKFQRGAANQSLLVETLGGMQTMKSLAVEPQARQKWERELAAYISSSLKVVTMGATGSQIVHLINKLSSATLLWFGAQAVIEGSLTIGAYIAFNMLAGQITGPVLRLSQLWQDFQQFKLSIARLGDILNTPPEPATGDSKQNPPPIRGEIRFENVGFRYSAQGPEVLRNLSLHIQAGEVVGVVGRSGSGKSTLTKLLQRLYLPERGRVMVDGIDLALLDPSWLRRQIGVVLQENFLFNRSVRENIALADPAIELEHVMRSAKLAGAHEFIVELPNGYDTVLEERGANLSGGQRQRIAIARALITNPRILIFDEATSALDYESERIIQNNMRAICQGRTVIVVAHRLSTVRQANRILVMEKGVLAESGSHEQLMQYGGLYANLVRQASG